MNFSDTQTCYKLIKKEIFESLKLTEKGFGIESEITMKISKLKLMKLFMKNLLIQ